MRKYKRILGVFWLLTVLFAALHFCFYELAREYRDWGWEPLVVPALGYLFPVVISAVAWREACANRKKWRKVAFMAAGAFAVLYLLMVAGITWIFLTDKGDYRGYYLNEPLLFAVIFFVLAVIWGIAKGNPAFVIEKKTWLGKIIYALPTLVFVALCLHLGYLGIYLLLHYKGMTTSFPAWILFAVYIIQYMIVIVGTLLLKGIYNFILRRKKETK